MAHSWKHSLRWESWLHIIFSYKPFFLIFGVVMVPAFSLIQEDALFWADIKSENKVL